MNENNDNLLEDNWESRLIEYSMGTMSAGEAEEFERQLSECRVHVKLADHYLQVVGWMGAAATPAEPPGGHKARLMARIAATPQESASASQTAVLPITSNIPIVSLDPQPGMTPYGGTDETVQPAPVTSLDEYRARRTTRPRALWLGAAAAVLALLVLAGWMSAVLGRPYVPPGYKTVAVRGQSGAENSLGVLMYDPARKDAYFLANGLQTLSAEQVYEMWLLPKGGGNPIPAGIFNVGSGGTARHEIQAPADMGEYAGVAVSLEKAPGSTVVGGPILLMGQYDTKQ